MKIGLQKLSNFLCLTHHPWPAVSKEWHLVYSTHLASSSCGSWSHLAAGSCLAACWLVRPAGRQLYARPGHHCPVLISDLSQQWQAADWLAGDCEL